jgi:hypothetical protein
MDTEKLDLFCEIYRDETILDKYSLIDIMIDLQIKTKDLRGIMYDPFLGSSSGNKNYDDLVYNAIDSLTYDKGADIEYVDKWLIEFEIGIEDILKNNLGSNEIGKYISVKHNDFHGTQEDKRKAHLIQVEFLDYFLKFYADFILPKTNVFLGSINKNEWQQIKLIGVDLEYLNEFCKSIFDESIAIKNSNRNSIKVLADKLEIEIIDNIINISDGSKVEAYFYRALHALEARQKKIHFSMDQMDRWISKFEMNLEDFPDFKNEELNAILDKKYSGTHNSVDERKEVFQIQTDFYFYWCKIQAEKTINFLNSKKMKTTNSSTENIAENNTAKIKWIGKPSQLGFIIGTLTELGYIEAPRKLNNDINFTEFAKLVKNTFEIVSTEGTLSKYLNLDTEKSRETKSKFESNKFEIPPASIVS